MNSEPLRLKFNRQEEGLLDENGKLWLSHPRNENTYATSQYLRTMIWGEIVTEEPPSPGYDGWVRVLAHFANIPRFHEEGYIVLSAAPHNTWGFKDENGRIWFRHNKEKDQCGTNKYKAFSGFIPGTFTESPSGEVFILVSPVFVKYIEQSLKAEQNEC